MIQPHGFLLGVDPLTGVVEVVSANLGEFLIHTADDALGRRLVEVLGAEPAGRLLARSGSAPLDGTVDQPIRTIRLPPPKAETHSGESGDGHRRTRWVEFEVSAHHADPLQIFAFEPRLSERDDLRLLYDSVHRTLDRPRGTDGAPTAVIARCAAAAQEVQILTGYDRVVVYRVGADAQGEVIAEARQPGVDSYLGLSFPPSAIPFTADTARDRSTSPADEPRIRLIVDVDADPVPLLRSPAHPAGAGQPRTAASVTGPVLGASPVGDRIYLRGLGIAAVMTMPLILDGRMWGLLSCHHRSPRRVSNDVRRACEVLARLLVLDVRSAQTRVERERLAHLGDLVVAVVSAMSLAPSMLAGAGAVPDALLGMVDADGVILQVDNERIILGQTPNGPDLDLLVAAVADLADAAAPVWSTDTLAELLDSTRRDRELDPSAAGSAAGVLYVPFAGRGSGYALWLRGPHPPTPSTASAPLLPPPVTGQPHVDADTDGGSAAPAPSRSRPWSAGEHTAAATFANAVPALLLQQARRVLAEQQLSAAKDQARAAHQHARLERQLHQNQRLESLGRLAGGVAHDFNNLLAAITGYLELITDEVDTEQATPAGARWAPVRADIDHITTAVARAGDLTHQLLAFARRETTPPQAVNLNTVITAVEALLRRSIGDGVHLVTDLADPLDPILADPGQIEQILVNLAVNARDAMPDGGTLTIDTAPTNAAPADTAAVDDPSTLRTRGEEHPQAMVQLRVHDTGTGMSREVADRIFEPFFTTKPPGEGTGLGLATVHGIVVQAGGRLAVLTETGSGTTFTLTFPATDAPPTPIAASRPVDTRPGQGTVLVVDDRPDIADVICRTLTGAGYTVLTAPTGDDAVTAAAAHPQPIDLLLTDLNMPGLSGDDTAALFCALYPHIRVVLMSGYAPLTGTVHRAHPVLDKPFTRAALLTAVTAALHDPPTPPTTDRAR